MNYPTYTHRKQIHPQFSDTNQLKRTLLITLILFLACLWLPVCTPSRISTIDHPQQPERISNIEVLLDMGDGLDDFTQDFILETKTQFLMNGIKNRFEQIDGRSFSPLKKKDAFILLIEEKKSSRSPFLFDFGLKTGWTWIGSIFGRTYSFNLTLYKDEQIIWSSIVHSSADKLFTMDIMGKEVSRDLLNQMKKESLLPERFEFVRYTLKDYD